MGIVKQYERCNLSDAKKYGTHYKLIKFCNGQCHCCSDTSECYLLKGGEDAVKEGKFIKDDKCKYQDGDGTWQATKTGGGDCYE